MNDLDKTIPQIERAARKIGLSLPQLCKRAGIDPWTWRRWKRGTHQPQIGKLKQLQRALEETE